MVKGEKRRALILDTAESLFYQYGYENTSIADLLSAVSLSKGGFYHHFESKQQLLDEICDAKALAACAHAREAMAQLKDPIAKLNVLFDKNGLWQEENIEFFGLLIRVGSTGCNMMMRERMKEKLTAHLLPVLTQIVQEGCAAKVFYTQYPVRISKILLDILHGFSDELARYLMACGAQTPELGEVLRMLEIYRSVTERLLDAPYGSVTLYQIRTIADTMMAVWQKYVRPDGKMGG